MIKKAIVIGSNSFSGGSFVNLLLAKNYKVIGISRSSINNKKFLNYNSKDKNFNFFKLDINKDQDSIIRLIKKTKPNFIINYAAQSMVGQSWQNAQDWFLTNSYSIPTLYKKIYDLNIIDRLIHISTPEVYGNTKSQINESNNYLPSTPYAVSRVTADLYLKILYEFQKFPFSSVRAANVYGEYQKLYRIIPKTVGCFYNKNKIKLHGGGVSKRSFIHIEDVSNATFLVMTKGKDGAVYHISNEDLISIKSLVKKISNKLKVDFNKYTILTDDRIGKDSIYDLCSTKIKKLGWESKITLDEGIDRVINWYSLYSDHFIKSDFDYRHKK